MLLESNRRLLMMVNKRILVLSLLCVLLNIGESTGASINVSDTNDGTEFFKSDEDAQRRLLDLAEEEKQQIVKEILKEGGEQNQLMLLNPREKLNDIKPYKSYLNEEKSLLTNNMMGESFNESKEINEKGLFEDEQQNNANMSEDNKELQNSNKSNVSSPSEYENTDATVEAMENAGNEINGPMENETRIPDGLGNNPINGDQMFEGKSTIDEGNTNREFAGSKTFETEGKEKLMSQNMSDFDQGQDSFSLKKNVNTETNITDEQDYQNEADGNYLDPKTKGTLNENKSDTQNYSSNNPMRPEDRRILEEGNDENNDFNTTRDAFIESEQNLNINNTEQEAQNQPQSENDSPTENSKRDSSDNSENSNTELYNAETNIPNMEQTSRENNESAPGLKILEEKPQERNIEQQIANRGIPLRESNNVLDTLRNNELLKEQEINRMDPESENEREMVSTEGETNKNDLLNMNYNTSNEENVNEENYNTIGNQSQIPEEKGKEQKSEIENVRETLRNHQLSISDLIRNYYIGKSLPNIYPKKKNNKTFDGRLIENIEYKGETRNENFTNSNEELTENSQQTENQTMNENTPNSQENLDQGKLSFLENVISNGKGTSIIPPQNGPTLMSIPNTANSDLVENVGRTGVPLDMPVYNEAGINLPSSPQTSDGNSAQFLNRFPSNENKIQSRNNDVDGSSNKVVQNDLSSAGGLERSDEAIDTQYTPQKNDLNFTGEANTKQAEEQETQLEKYPIIPDNEMPSNYISNDTNENESKVSPNTDSQGQINGSDNESNLNPFNNANDESTLKNSSSDINQKVNDSLPNENDGESKYNLQNEELNNRESASQENAPSLMSTLIKNYNNVLLPVVNNMIYAKQPENSSDLKLTELQTNENSSNSPIDNKESGVTKETGDYETDNLKNISEDLNQGENTSAGETILNNAVIKSNRKNAYPNNSEEINNEDNSQRILSPEISTEENGKALIMVENSTVLENIKENTILPKDVSGPKDNLENEIGSNDSTLNLTNSGYNSEIPISCFRRTEISMDKDERPSLFSHFPPECLAEPKVDNENIQSMTDLDNVSHGRINSSNEGKEQMDTKISSTTGNIMNNIGYETNIPEDGDRAENLSVKKIIFDEPSKGLLSETISKTGSENVEGINLKGSNETDSEGNEEKSEDLPTLTEAKCVNKNDNMLTFNDSEERNKSEVSCFIINQISNSKNKTQEEDQVSSFRNSLFNKPTMKDTEDSSEEEEETLERRRRDFDKSEKNNTEEINELKIDSEMYNGDSIDKKNVTKSNTDIADTDEEKEETLDGSTPSNIAEDKYENSISKRNNTTDSQEFPKTDINKPIDITKKTDDVAKEYSEGELTSNETNTLVQNTLKEIKNSVVGKVLKELFSFFLS